MYQKMAELKLAASVVSYAVSSSRTHTQEEADLQWWPPVCSAPSASEKAGRGTQALAL